MYYISCVLCIAAYAYFCRTNSVFWRDSYCDPFYMNKGFTVLSLIFCLTVLLVPFVNVCIIFVMVVTNVSNMPTSKYVKVFDFFNKRLF